MPPPTYVACSYLARATDHGGSPRQDTPWPRRGGRQGRRPGPANPAVVTAMAGWPNPAGVRVRAAGRGDLPTLVALRQSVGWNSGGLEGSLSAADSGRQAILLAEIDDRAVGAVAMSFQAPATGAFRRGHISDLLVTPLYRRRGIGAMLLQAAERAITARGLIEVTLDVDAHNHPALALYFGSGYVHHRPAQFPWGPGYTLRKVLVPMAAGSRDGPLLRWWRRWSAGPRIGRG